MPYSYTGNFPDQQLKNSGVFSPADSLNLTSFGEWGGSLQLIKEQSYSASTYADCTEIEEDKYQTHLLVVDGFVPQNDGEGLRIRLYESGVLETGSNYLFCHKYNQASGSHGEQNGTTETNVRFILGQGNDEVGHSRIYLNNFGNSTKFSSFNYHSTTYNTTSNLTTNFGQGALKQASKVDGFRLYVSTGNLTLNLKLYGVKNLL